MVKLRRGFVKESEEYAVEYRQELGLADNAPLCPRSLAKYLAIPLFEVSTHPTIPDEVKRLVSKQGNSGFSAMTIADGPYREILHNDYQHPNRQNSNIMHEIAHIVLGHPPKPPIIGDACRSFDAIKEREANELGFALLVPKPAALYAVEAFPRSRKEAAIYFGVSTTLLEYRIRKTNALGWLNNRRRRSVG